MPELGTIISPRRQRRALDFGAAQSFEAVVSRVEASGVWVVIPAFDGGEQPWGPCLPPGASVQEGDAVTVLMSNGGRPWLVGGAGGGEGGVGPQGPQGPPGPAGPQGPAGQSGPQGPPGAQGASGPAGPQGQVGQVGPAGASGPQGVAGPAGATGPAGPMGPEGPIGSADIDGGRPDSIYGGVPLIDGEHI